jgi:hypothetical protein
MFFTSAMTAATAAIEFGALLGLPIGVLYFGAVLFPVVIITLVVSYTVQLACAPLATLKRTVTCGILAFVVFVWCMASSFSAAHVLNRQLSQCEVRPGVYEGAEITATYCKSREDLDSEWSEMSLRQIKVIEPTSKGN